MSGHDRRRSRLPGGPRPYPGRRGRHAPLRRPNVTWTLVEGDCLAALPRLEEASVDVCDLPRDRLPALAV
jgi:hypothetical protein